MTAVSARMAEALAAGRPLALIAAIDHPDGMVRVWSRAGTLAWNGESWLGIGALGRVTPISSSLELAIQEIAFEIRGVPATALQLLSDKVRGRSGELWLAAMAPRRRVVADPFYFGAAELDYQTLSIGDDLTATIRVTAYMGFYTLQKAQNLVWSREAQDRRFPDRLDSGFDLMTANTVKEIKWDRT